MATLKRAFDTPWLKKAIDIERPLKRPRVGRYAKTTSKLPFFKTRRPPPIITTYNMKEVKQIFCKQYYEQHDFFNYHIKNAKPFVYYRNGDENEGIILVYYETNGNRPGISPFDLLHSDDVIEEINQDQRHWERTLRLPPNSQPWKLKL